MVGERDLSGYGLLAFGGLVCTSIALGYIIGQAWGWFTLGIGTMFLAFIGLLVETTD